LKLFLCLLPSPGQSLKITRTHLIQQAAWVVPGDVYIVANSAGSER
jgi:hypothetical protein